MSDWLFYKRAASPATASLCPQGYEWAIWRPSFRNVVPAGLPLFPFAMWWLFHQFRVFANRDYAILLVMQGQKVLHRSVLTPKYARFPFMAADDMQIGDTWTDESHRGKGLASFALQKLVASSGLRHYWYIVASSNAASIRVVEKCGFAMAGAGIRTQPFGVRLLGVYLLESSAGGAV